MVAVPDGRLAKTVISLMTILLFLGRILQERLSACYSVVSFFPHSFSLTCFFCFVKGSLVLFLFPPFLKLVGLREKVRRADGDEVEFGSRQVS